MIMTVISQFPLKGFDTKYATNLLNDINMSHTSKNSYLSCKKQEATCKGLKNVHM